MRVTTAQVPGPSESDDRVLVGPDVVIMLDGASAFASTDATAADYVDQLGPALLGNLAGHPEVGLVEALADAIELTAAALRLSPGSSPSSTVAIARSRRDSIDVLALGDTQIVTPQRTLRDDRLSEIGARHRHAYRHRLRDGRGFDDKHRALLRELQQEQRHHRNRRGGYWIAEADPSAATQALVQQLSQETVPWLILATDGAYRPMEHLGIDDWASLSNEDQTALFDVLNRCYLWESDQDPKGAELPRAKQHDDKSLAVVSPGN